MDSNELKAKFKDFAQANGIENPSMEIVKFRTRDCYFNNHSIDFSEMMENVDNIDFNREMEFRDNHPTIDEDAVRKNIEEILVEMFDDFDPVEYGVTVKGDGEMAFTKDENGLPNITHELLDKIQECYENADITEFDEYQFGLLFDVEYDFNEESDIYQGLSYYSTYYEPRWFDEETAYLCGLIPFEYDGVKLLALGGGGMDLSPKLDAYQAFTDSSIPSDSKFLKEIEKNYFESVSGFEFEIIAKEVSLPKPRIIFSGDMEC